MSDSKQIYEDYHDQAAKIFNPPRPRVTVADIDHNRQMLTDAIESYEAIKDNTPENRTANIQIGRNSRHKLGREVITPYPNVQCEMMDVLSKYLQVRIVSLRRWFDDRGIDPGV